MKIDAGVVTSMMENPPHVGADSTNIENIIQPFVDKARRRDSVVVAVVSDVQQKECLRDRIQQVEADEPPGIRLERVKGNPAARQHRQPHSDLDPHGEVGLGRNVRFGKEIIEASTQDFGERRVRGRIENGVSQGGLPWRKIIDLRVQIGSRLVGFIGNKFQSTRRISAPSAKNRVGQPGELGCSNRISGAKRARIDVSGMAYGRSREFRIGPDRRTYACSRG
jgi:hypothetical protein